MKWLNNLTQKDGVVAKITNVVDAAVTDKDKRNKLIYEITLILMQSKVAPFIRGLIAITTVVAVLFFGDRIKLDQDTQKIILSSVYGFYFLDFVKSMFGKK